MAAKPFGNHKVVDVMPMMVGRPSASQNTEAPPKKFVKNKIKLNFL
jgi:hypothetical protein